MSKYEQMSNWGNPSLRKAQILYGGMDALITLKLFEKLKEEIEKQVKIRNLLKKLSFCLGKRLYSIRWGKY